MLLAIVSKEFERKFKSINTTMFISKAIVYVEYQNLQLLQFSILWIWKDWMVQFLTQLLWRESTALTLSPALQYPYQMIASTSRVSNSRATRECSFTRSSFSYCHLPNKYICTNNHHIHSNYHWRW
ncbi:hypothetical protein EB796_008401 [Bugula neritina]|uniref:Uncharacterized protein n=1 Tax=Bugula neritina TaxID=10212 RepID=A0A7J7K5W3_BUGNE|nr:hypothetical protein EB796_008401 [Bugula neritina]